jgi:hypothetical protein
VRKVEADARLLPDRVRDDEADARLLPDRVRVRDELLLDELDFFLAAAAAAPRRRRSLERVDRLRLALGVGIDETVDMFDRIHFNLHTGRYAILRRIPLRSARGICERLRCGFAARPLRGHARRSSRRPAGPRGLSLALA